MPGRLFVPGQPTPPTFFFLAASGGFSAHTRGVVMPGVLAVIGVIFLFLAGINVAGPRFAPGWLGLAFVALAVLWAPITALGG